MLRLIPLGGLGEIGLNALILESGSERLLVDAGVLFPPPDMPGVDVILPDFAHLLAQPERLTGVVLTHGHEDHVGALAALLQRMPRPVPVYGGRYTLGVVARKLEEAGVEVPLHEIEPRRSFSVGERFRVEPLNVCHSTPDAMAFSIDTDEGRIVHTGDFKLDDSPWDGRPTDLTRLGELGEEGVLCLLSDSTNSEVEGHTGSEALVAETFEALFRAAPSRLVLTMFASNIPRVHHALRLAEAVGRRVVLVGRAMVRAVELAESLHHVRIPPGLMATVAEAGRLPRERVLALTTGAQGEPRAGLQQLARGELDELRLEPGDHVLLSARAIPGNERAVSDLINRLCSRGVRVFYPGNTPGLHVSGHAARAQQRKVIETVRPKHFVPIHGESRMLQRHLETAREAGLTPEGLLLTGDGDVLEFQEGRGRLAGAIPAGRRWIARPGDLEVNEEALTMRRYLAENGAVTVTVVLNADTGALMAGPVLGGRGLTAVETEHLPRLADAIRPLFLTLSPMLRLDTEAGTEALLRASRRAFRERLNRRPVITPQIVKL